MAKVIIAPNTTTLADTVAHYIAGTVQLAIEEHQQCFLALSGGNTPQETFSRLVEPDIASQIDWTRVFVFWGDERCVPPDNPASNYRMAAELLLNRVPIPTQNIYRMHGEKNPNIAAAEYEETLKELFGRYHRINNGPRFDLDLLGMGENGHTASLFPHTPALEEKTRWVIAQNVTEVNQWRITLTPVALNAARHTAFLVTGSKKAEMLNNVINGSYQPELWPVQLINPQHGDLIWFIDKAAARYLQK